MARKTMSAVMEDIGRIVLREFDLPQIGPEEALLKVEMAGVCGSDPAAYHGKMRTHKPPYILGHENVGHIAEIGEVASRRYGVKKGDRVIPEPFATCGHCYYCVTGRHKFCLHKRGYFTSVNIPPHLWGGYGEYMYLPPGAKVHKISPDVPAEAAVLVDAVLANGIQWTRVLGGASIGQTVVIQGAGPQGLVATIAAREAGASPVITTGLRADRERLKLAKRFGADYTIVADEENVVERVREITEGKMADLVVDVTGAPAAIVKSIDMVKKQGTVVCAGMTGTDILTPIATDKLAWNEIRFQGAYTNSTEATLAAIKLAESRRYPLEEMVTHRFPLEKAEEAVKTMGGDMPGVYPIKVVIVPGG